LGHKKATQTKALPAEIFENMKTGPRSPE